MRLAIMQPYFFPYIGYFQLVSNVDRFVFLDDVNFIKKGWINRNYILNQSDKLLITIPLKAVSQNSLICETAIDYSQNWQDKLEKTLVQSYKKAPHFDAIHNLFKRVLESKPEFISDLAKNSTIEVLKYLEIKTALVPTSSVYQNSTLKAENRILDICVQEKASVYWNPIGGTELYESNAFKDKGIELGFLKLKPIVYPQFKEPFVPWLSILDVLMFNSTTTTLNLLKDFEIQT